MYLFKKTSRLVVTAKVKNQTTHQFYVKVKVLIIFNKYLKTLQDC